MSITETKDGTILTVYVKPNSPKFKLELDGEELVIYSTEEPEKGKVNKEIIKELTKLFHKQVEIVFGFTSRQKKFLIRGAEKQEIESFLKTLSN